jgi:hypothetical protein
LNERFVEKERRVVGHNMVLRTPHSLWWGTQASASEPDTYDENARIDASA